MKETWVPSLGRADPLEKEIATHSSIFAWRILWTEEPGGPSSVVLQQSRKSDVTEQRKDSNTDRVTQQKWGP